MHELHGLAAARSRSTCFCATASFCHAPVQRGRDLVVVIDASGSMQTHLPLVVNEVKRMVEALKPTHRLTVVTFSGRGVWEPPFDHGPTCLPTCTPKWKASLVDWLTLDRHSFKTGGSGATHVLAALERAASYEPELIFVLSDGSFGRSYAPGRIEIGADDMLASFRRHKESRRRSKINTIQYLNEDPLARAGRRGTLRALAEETGGRHKFVSRRELNLR
ncbi:MAG: vWA domain-containing protein [Phycisphaeraceae bacterium]